MLRDVREWRALLVAKSAANDRQRSRKNFLVGEKAVIARSREGLQRTGEESLLSHKKGADGWNRCDSSDERKG
jgi:hypothetical protein